MVQSALRRSPRTDDGTQHRSRSTWSVFHDAEKPGNSNQMADGFFTGQYNLAARPANATAEPWASPFGYLPNFFLLAGTQGNGQRWFSFWQRVQSGGGTNPGQVGSKCLNWSRRLRFYADGKRWMDPSNLSGGNNIQNYLLGARVAPFNFVSNYRVPGKVNLNTIKHQSVLDAIEFNYDRTARNIEYD